MRIIALLIIFTWLVLTGQKKESPHGEGFKVSCSKCHSASGWQFDSTVYSFEHNRTKMPLTGRHTSVTCRQCHTSLVFSEAKAECNQCHTDMHQNTTGLDCSRCHNTFSWLVSDITGIHNSGRFPLLGAHRTADCFECHKSDSRLRFDVPGINCIDCHRGEFISTTNPNHVSAGFSQDCASCHPANSSQWTGSGFNHTFFPLMLGHNGLNCSECHTTSSYSDASPVCYSCHQAAFMSTTNPNHTASNFPTTCEKCHTLNPGWKPASFDHSAFPLTLGHSGVACSQCHINNSYSNTSAECYSCHKTDYEGASNPSHTALSFSTNCTECHTTNPQWKPAKYTQHDNQFFPIYSGRHKGTWDSCAECHTNPSNYASFDCKSCHSNVHRDKNYSNAECYSCHPRGTGD